MLNFFKKEDKEQLKKEWDSLEQAQKLLDHRYESKAMGFATYNAQCIELGKKREKLRKKLGYDLYS